MPSTKRPSNPKEKSNKSEKDLDRQVARLKQKNSRKDARQSKADKHTGFNFDAQLRQQDAKDDDPVNRNDINRVRARMREERRAELAAFEEKLRAKAARKAAKMEEALRKEEALRQLKLEGLGFPDFGTI